MRRIWPKSWADRKCSQSDCRDRGLMSAMEQQDIDSRESGGFMTRTLRSVLGRAAQAFKGPDYVIDPELPIGGYISLAYRRGFAVTRGILRRVSRPLHPSTWVFLGRGVEIRNKRQIHFWSGVSIGSGSILDGLSRGGVWLGDGVSLGPYSVIEATGVVTDLGEGCWIGDRTGLGHFLFIGAAGGVRIGNDVLIGNRVSFHSENHIFEDAYRLIRDQGVTRHGIVVEDDCWIGANVTILDGVTIGRGSVIAAGSVVRDVVPPYSVAAGVPARVVRSRSVG